MPQSTSIHSLYTLCIYYTFQSWSRFWSLYIMYIISHARVAEPDLSQTIVRKSLEFFTAHAKARNEVSLWRRANARNVRLYILSVLAVHRPFYISICTLLRSRFYPFETTPWKSRFYTLSTEHCFDSLRGVVSTLSKGLFWLSTTQQTL